MSNPSLPDFEALRASQITEADFARRREPYLRYEIYRKLFNEFVDGMQMVSTELPRHLATAPKYGLVMSSQQRLWDALDWFSLHYSAGAPVALLAGFWPYALAWAEEYAAYHCQYHVSPENIDGIITPHVAMEENEYWRVALRLVCFGLLTGHAAQMPRVMALLDYVNAELGIHDGLLERLVAPWVPGRPVPDKATRHLPYRKLFKVFAAPAEKRPGLMVKYLEEWYHASRREPYVGQHERSGIAFYGYWSWEAAATSHVLGMDDSSYREMPFYPKDLADFARQLPAQASVQATRLRVPAGEPCPQSGWWQAPAGSGRRYFAQGEEMPEVRSDYGATVWEWSLDQAEG